MPHDRVGRYEETLHEVLSGSGIGEVTGGGTALLASGEVAYVDIEITLAQGEPHIAVLIELLEAFGAPIGSRLIIHDEDAREMSLGKAEGVAVYLNGTDLPPKVYATSDVNAVIAELEESISGVGEMQSHWEGPRETALYFYGSSAAEMRTRMSGILASHPLCAQARVAEIASPAA